MKEITDFRVFKKAIRKYYKRHCVKRIDHFKGKRFVSYWEERDWVGYRITDSKQLTPAVCKYIRFMIGDEVYQSLKHLDEFIDNNPNVWFEGEDKGWSLRGVMLTNRDAYIIISESYDSKEQYLYPMYKLVNCRHNLYPCGG